MLYLLVALLCAAALAIPLGPRIVENWHVVGWEDLFFFRYNSDQIHSLSDCFTKKGLWPGLYRPLTTNLYYYLGGIALGNRVEAYHFINLVFLILNAVLLYRLAAMLLGSWWGLVPPVLFVSRFAMVQIALYTTEFQGLLYVFFTILSVDLFIRSRKADSTWMLSLSALAFALALLSKESAFVLPALLIVYGRLFDDRPAVRPYLAHPLVGLLWAILFVVILRRYHAAAIAHDFTVSNVLQSTFFHYDYSVSNLLNNYIAYFLDFSNWLLSPLQNFGMSARAYALAANWYVRLLFGLLIVLESALLLFPRSLKSRALRVVAFGFAWFLVTTFPFVIFGDRLFIRYSYLGHAGLALCVGAIVSGVCQLVLPRVASYFSNRATLVEPLFACFVAIVIAATSAMGSAHVHIPQPSPMELEWMRGAEPPAQQPLDVLTYLRLAIRCSPLPSLDARIECVYWETTFAK